MTTQTKITNYSAGDGKTFELVDNNGKIGFAVYDSKTGHCTFVEQYDLFQPMQTIPWLLAEMPLEYNNAFELFKEVRSYIYDHVEVQCDEEYDVLAAWVMAAYRYSDFQSFPYISAIGTTKLR